MNVTFAIEITAAFVRAKDETLVARAINLSPHLVAPLDLLINQAVLSLETRKHEYTNNGRKRI